MTTTTRNALAHIAEGIATYGGIFVLGTILAALLGRPRAVRFVDWWSARSRGFTRAWAALAALFGGFLVTARITVDVPDTLGIKPKTHLTRMGESCAGIKGRPCPGVLDVPHKAPEHPYGIVCATLCNREVRT